MMNIYLFIELLRSANATQIVDTLKSMKMENCKFANVVALSDSKIVAQLDCIVSSDGDKAILNQIAKVDGVVQTNIVAVVRNRRKQGCGSGKGWSEPNKPEPLIETQRSAAPIITAPRGSWRGACPAWRARAR